MKLFYCYHEAQLICEQQYYILYSFYTSQSTKLQFQAFMHQCCSCYTGRMNSKQREGVHYSRQCNQAEAAITQKVDLTTGHLVKLKTRHLHCTYSLANITPINCDWLSGELVPYKRQSNSVADTVDWHHLLHRHPSSSPVVFPSQKVSYEELQHKFVHVL